MTVSSSVALVRESNGPSLPLAGNYLIAGQYVDEEQMLRENEYLVTMVASWYAGRGKQVGFDLDDLQQEARLALILQAPHFNPAYGVSFKSYIVHQMKFAVCAILRENAGGLIKFSRRFLAQGLTPPEVVTETDLRAEARHCDPLIDKGEVEEFDLEALLAGGSEMQRLTETSGWLELHLGQLPELQRDIVLLRNVAELTGEQTAQVLGITPDAVDYHEKRGLLTLRADWIADEERADKEVLLR